MNEMGIFSRRLQTFCAFCKNRHLIYRRKHIGVAFGLLIGAMVTVVTFTLYGDFHPLALVLLLACLTAADLATQLRWRLSLRCPHCGFDPVTYLKDAQRAAEQVKSFVAEKRSEPQSWLKPDPLRHLRHPASRAQHNDLAEILAGPDQTDPKMLES
jgi:hypothetical protein